MSQRDISIGLDIGTSAIKAVAVRWHEPSAAPQVIGASFAPASGLRRGVIVDVEKTVKSIEKAILDLQKKIGFKPSQVYVNLAGCNIGTLVSRGIIAVSRADGEIDKEDIERVIGESQKVSLPPNREILHIVPRNFIVDGESGIKDAQGMHGIRLEVESLLVLGSSPAVKNLVKCLDLLDVEVKSLIVSSLASAETVLSSRDKELGVAVLDIGAATCDLAIFEEGDLVHLAVIPIGSSHITNDIAIGLRVPIDLAEKIKIDCGVSTVSQALAKKETIDISKLSESERGMFSKRELAEIIEARLCEIFELVNKEFKKIGRQNLLPAGIVLSGGGARLPGIVEIAKRELRLPSRLAKVALPSLELKENIIRDLTESDEGEMIGGDDNSSLACAAGLAFWKFRNVNHENNGKKKFGLPNPIRGAMDKVKNIFKIFIP